MSIDLKKLAIDDILARLDEREMHVSALGSTTDDGWEQTIAWNPVEILEIPYDATKDPTNKVEIFAERQKQAGRMIIGYLSYDVGCLLHNVTLDNSDDLKTPLAYLLSFDNWISFKAGASIVHTKSATFTNKILDIMSRSAREIPTKMYQKQLSPTWSRHSYNMAYKRVHDYIQAGDIYQTNLTHRLEGTTESKGVDIYRKVLMTSHADFQSYIAGSNFEVISASPERFVRIHDGIITTMPIKGTRARGANPNQDKSLRTDLESSPKDQAELDMITDLMRNDLGVISQIGTVDVLERRVIKGYPTVWHAHSKIQAMLRHDVSPIVALVSLMPGGSITGCPKKRAMEVINEVELKRRGIYTGSIFTIKPNGELDSNIAIRTLIKKSDKIYLSVGGGIVYDSTQADEYEESLQKAASFLQLD